MAKRKSVLRILTNSERSAMACPRHWWFSYSEGLSQYLTPAPLKAGSLFHQGVEAWSRSVKAVQAGGAEEPLTGGELESRVIEPWLEKRELYRGEAEQRGVDTTGQGEEDEDIARMTTGMLRGYIHQHAGDVEEWEYFAVEAQVSRWLVHPKHGKAITDMITVKGERRRRRWAYGGALDLVWRHIPTDTWWFRENKTAKIAAGDLAFDRYMRDLHFAPQVRGYAWALQDPILADATEGIDGPIHVEGVVMDVARKAVPRAPTALTKCRNCGHSKSKHSPLMCEGSKSCGCNLHQWQTAGLSTAAIDTTADVYRLAVLEAGLDPDDYADTIANLPGDASYFRREHYDFTSEEIADFGRDAGWSALAMIQEERAEYHTRQTRVCTGPGSFGCPGGFESLCMQDGPLARQSYRVKTIRHAELTGNLAEPWMGVHRGVGTPPANAPAPDPFEEPAHDDDDDADPFKGMEEGY